jgi:deoxyribose-phosphate aldolase
VFGKLGKGSKGAGHCYELPYPRGKKLAAELIAKCGMGFVKISTVFSFLGATEENVKLLHSVSRSRPKIKASSGIKAKEQGVEFLLLGAESICIF